jgi:ParB/RepB/Spo0J family partition protein
MIGREDERDWKKEWTKAWNIEWIPIDKITPNSEQPRQYFDQEELYALARSYKENGIIYPIDIDEENRIITGERRWRSARMAGLRKVPCRRIVGLTENEKFTRSLVENINHAPLTALELGDDIKKMKEMNGWNNAEVAGALGRTETEIGRILALNEAPQELKNLVMENKLDATNASLIAQRLRDIPEEAVKVAQTVAEAEHGKRELTYSLIRGRAIPQATYYDVILAEPDWSRIEAVLGTSVKMAIDCSFFLLAPWDRSGDAIDTLEILGFKCSFIIPWVQVEEEEEGFTEAELLFVGTRGNFLMPDKDAVLRILREEQKKSETRKATVKKMIQRLFPDHRGFELEMTEEEGIEI